MSMIGVEFSHRIELRRMNVSDKPERKPTTVVHLAGEQLDKTFSDTLLRFRKRVEIMGTVPLAIAIDIFIEELKKERRAL